MAWSSRVTGATNYPSSSPTKQREIPAIMLHANDRRRSGGYPAHSQSRRRTVEEMEDLQGQQQHLPARYDVLAAAALVKSKRARGIYGRGPTTALHAPAYGSRDCIIEDGHYRPQQRSSSMPIYSDGAPDALESSDYLDGYNDGLNYFGSLLLRVCIVCVLIAWLFGNFAPFNHMSGRISLLATPLDPIGTLLPANQNRHTNNSNVDVSNDDRQKRTAPRPDFVYEDPYVSSSYYTSTKNIETLLSMQEAQATRNLRREAEDAAGMDSSSPQQQHETKNQSAIVQHQTTPLTYGSREFFSTKDMLQHQDKLKKEGMAQQEDTENEDTSSLTDELYESLLLQLEGMGSLVEVGQPSQTLLEEMGRAVEAANLVLNEVSQFDPEF